MSVNKAVYNDHTVSLLRSSIIEGSAGLSDVPGLLKQVIREDMWRDRVVQKTGEPARFERFEEFVATLPLEGLGTDMATLFRLCADDAEAADLLDQATQNPHGVHQKSRDVNNVNVTTRPEGNDRQYAIRRLRKSAPELHARVIAGELTPHAAMVEAGFRKRQFQADLEPEAVARALARHFTQAEICEIFRRATDHGNRAEKDAA